MYIVSTYYSITAKPCYTLFNFRFRVWWWSWFCVDNLQHQLVRRWHRRIKNSQPTARTYLCRWNYLPDYWWVNVEELSASSLYGCRQWNRYRRSVASPLPRHFISFMNRCGWWLLWWCALSISLAHSLDTTTVAKAIDPFTISLAVSIAAELPNSHLPCWARQTIRYGLLGGC